MRSEHDEGRDRTIARHVIGIHQNRAEDSQVVGEVDIDKMKRFIAYVKLCVADMPWWR